MPSRIFPRRRFRGTTENGSLLSQLRSGRNDTLRLFNASGTTSPTLMWAIWWPALAAVGLALGATAMPVRQSVKPMRIEWMTPLGS
jgi:hypothetical protein